jgi:tellurite methyltransferase
MGTWTHDSDALTTVVEPSARNDYLKLGPNGYVSHDKYWGEHASGIALTVPPPDPTDPAPRALDLGCGQGRNIAALSERGYAVTAVDVLESACRCARMAHPEADVVCADAVTFVQSWPENSVSAIIGSHLIQHLATAQRLRSFMHACESILRPGGVIGLSLFTGAADHHPPEVAESALLLPAGQLRSLYLTPDGYHLLLLENETIRETHPGYGPHSHEVERIVAQKHARRPAMRRRTPADAT